jgi:Leucine-rich repeat (LRR) protein
MDNGVWNLQEVDFEGNKIGDAAIEILCDGLDELSNFKYLNLSDNNLTHVSAPFLAQVFHVGKIKELHLRFNRLQAKGGLILAQRI